MEWRIVGVDMRMLYSPRKECHPLKSRFGLGDGSVHGSKCMVPETVELKLWASSEAEQAMNACLRVSTGRTAHPADDLAQQ